MERILSTGVLKVPRFVFIWRFPSTKSPISDAVESPLTKVTRVVDFSSALRLCDNFNQNLNEWSVSSATDIKQMFAYSFSFNQGSPKFSQYVDSSHKSAHKIIIVGIQEPGNEDREEKEEEEEEKVRQQEKEN